MPDMPFLFLLFLLFSNVQAEKPCRTSNLHFIAESSIERKEADYLFYGVASDVDNFRECARICYAGNFCRSALFDPDKHSCKLGYANVRNCPSEPLQMFSSDEPVRSLLISCITCKDNGEQKFREPFTLPVQGITEGQLSRNVLLSASTEGRPQSMHKSFGAVDLAKAVVEQLDVTGKLTTPPTTTAFSSKPVVVSNDSCFKRTKQQAFVKTAYQVYRGYSLTDCQCTCAQTWAGNEVVCSSIQYYPERQECVLNKLHKETDHVGDDLVDVKTLNTSLYEFTCDQSRPNLFGYLLNTCSYDVLPKVGVRYNVDCHDIVIGHSLKGAAGALQHDVSVETCRCLCFASSNIEKFGFVCRSASYYPKERDCVLNLYDRWQRPDLFNQETISQSIIYLDASCEGSKRLNLINRCKADMNMGKSLSHTSGSSLDPHVSQTFVHEPPTLVQSDNKSGSEIIGDHSDSCFLEIPNYVLGNTVESIQNQLTVEECKCKCVNSKELFGFDCLSILYLTPMSKCWLNKFNRLQQPQSFNKAHSNKNSTSQFSYYEYMCNPNGEKGRAYASVCSNVAAGKGRKAAILPEPRRLPSIDATTGAKYANNILAKDVDVKALLQQVPAPAASPVQLTTVMEEAPAAELTTSVPSDGTSEIPGLESLTTPKFDFSEYVGGSCSYSALYDAEFGGRNLLEKFLVEQPLHCFVECVKRRCRSANLVLFLGKFKHCYLYGDSAVEYPFTNMVTFRKGSVYFEGISCAPRSPTKTLQQQP